MIFLCKTGKTLLMVGFWSLNFIPQINIYTDVSYTSNKDHMPKLQPLEVDVPNYPNRAQTFRISSHRVRFLDVNVFFLFFLNNK